MQSKKSIQRGVEVCFIQSVSSYYLYPPASQDYIIKLLRKDRTGKVNT